MKGKSTGITLLNVNLNLLTIEILNMRMQAKKNNKYIIMKDIDYLYTMFRQKNPFHLVCNLCNYIYSIRNDDT